MHVVYISLMTLFAVFGMLDGPPSTQGIALVGILYFGIIAIIEQQKKFHKENEVSKKK